MGKFSRAKGARGERELANLLKDKGFDARRGQQFSGVEGKDVICEELDFLHIECKLVERLNIQQAYEQSKRDAGAGEIPTVFHRKKRCDWLVTLGMDDFLQIIKGGQLDANKK